jgi:hypothetical protein
MWQIILQVMQASTCQSGQVKLQQRRFIIDDENGLKHGMCHALLWK